MVPGDVDDVLKLIGVSWSWLELGFKLQGGGIWVNIGRGETRLLSFGLETHSSLRHLFNATLVIAVTSTILTTRWSPSTFYIPHVASVTTSPHGTATNLTVSTTPKSISRLKYQRIFTTTTMRLAEGTMRRWVQMSPRMRRSCSHPTTNTLAAGSTRMQVIIVTSGSVTLLLPNPLLHPIDAPRLRPTQPS